MDYDWNVIERRLRGQRQFYAQLFQPMDGGTNSLWLLPSVLLTRRTPHLNQSADCPMMTKRERSVGSHLSRRFRSGDLYPSLTLNPNQAPLPGGVNLAQVPFR